MKMSFQHVGKYSSATGYATVTHFEYNEELKAYRVYENACIYEDAIRVRKCDIKKIAESFDRMGFRKSSINELF